MTVRLVFRPQARRELLEARAWYDDQRSGLGADFAHEADRALAQMIRSPEAFPGVYHEIRRIRLHRFPYAIYYRLLADEAIVLAVMHGRRHPRRWQSRR